MEPAEIKMEPAEIKLFVGGVSHNTNEQTLRDYFSKYGELRSCDIIRDRITGLGRGFGFIVFADSSVVEHVLSDTHVILGKKVEVKVAKPKGSREAMLETRSVKKVFVGGIPPDSTDEELVQHFEKFGIVEDAEIRRPRGFGFVTFESEEGAKSALRIPFQYMKNKRIEVKVAEVKAKVGLNNGMRNPLPNMTFPVFPTTNWVNGNPKLVNYVPVAPTINWYSYGASEFCYNSYYPAGYNGGNWQDLNNPNPSHVVTRPPLANSQPVVIRPPPSSSKLVVGPPPASKPVVIRPPPAKVEEQNGNVAVEIDEIQGDEIDDKSLTNGEVQIQDEIDGESLTNGEVETQDESDVAAGDSF
nr:RNA-binding protein Musashi homolog 2-like [Ipomoea trifida]